MESDWIESHLSRPVLSEGLWRRPLKSESSQPIRDVIENNKALGKEKEVAYNDPEIDDQRLGSA